MTTTLRRASLGYVRRHPWQLSLALLGIVIGVGVMVAVDTATRSAERAFELSLETLNGRATHQVIGGPSGIDEALYAELRRTHGFRQLAPVVDGEVIVGNRVLPVLGVDLFAESGVRAYSTGSGRVSLQTMQQLLTQPGAVLMTQNTASALQLDGGGFEAVADGVVRPARFVSAIGAAGGADRENRLDDLLVVDIATAQAWFNRRGRLSRIDAVLPDEGEARRLAAALPPGLQLIDAGSRMQHQADVTQAFTTNLFAMSLLAILVGVFLIYNSVGFAVIQRRGLIATLRALGLTRGEVFGWIVAEALVLGAAGTVLGLVLGTWLGDHLLDLVTRSINDLYFRVQARSIAVTPDAMLLATTAGLGATVVAAIVPALEAASVPPSLALQRSSLEAGARRAVPWLTVSGVALLLLALPLLTGSVRSLVAGLVGLFLLILGSALCIPLVVRGVVPRLAHAARKAWGSVAGLAIAGIDRSLSRTGVAIVALAIAVSATMGVELMVGSFRQAVSDWVDRALQADLYVGVAGGGIDATLLADIAALPELRAVSTSRRVWLESGDGRTRLIALRRVAGSETATLITRGDESSAWQAFDHDGAVFVSEPFAYRRNAAVGDTVRLPTVSGPQDFRIAAVYRSYDADQGAVLMSRTTYDRHWGDARVDSLGLYLADRATADAVVAALRELSRDRQALRISDNATLKRLSLAVFDRTFVITHLLYWLATGVAVIGILGATLAMQMERARELGVLRALGLTPWQLGGLVTLQSAVIGLLSGIAAIPLGWVMARALVDVINRRSFGWSMELGLSPSVLAAGVAVAVAAATVAGLYPAWRAANALPAAAMREE